MANLTEILKGSDYALTIFTDKEIKAIKIFDKGGKPYLTCAASDKAPVPWIRTLPLVFQRFLRPSTYGFSTRYRTP